jgi:catechol 2,3-dioxygenase-like lactoylglutathione lyase family enzyme
METGMAIIKVTDIAYGRVRAPDLDAMEAFLIEFGMVRADRTADALYMRGTDPDHHIHVTEKGDPGFIGFAYHAASEDDLEAVSRAPGASGIETIDAPGGGRRVRLNEPNGYQIEVVHGIDPLPQIPVAVQEVNSGAAPNRRAGEVMRIHRGRSRVKRIGHGVLATPNLPDTVKWFRETLGFVCSDDVYAGTEDNLMGSFNRCDRGDEYVDHHVFFCMRNPRAGLNHLSFEVQDVDDVFTGHQHLDQLGRYQHIWGLGRHLLGSQVYDYWADPWGRVHEHWADSDRLNLDNGSNLISAEEGLDSQWGEPPPDSFIDHVSP